MIEDDRRQRLSLLLDGETDAKCAQEACQAWRDDRELRATWHAYHLIGDVLRSEDLAHPAARDEALLAALRQRLAAEPAVLAPAPSAVARATVPARAHRNRRWGGAAVAAGVAAVVGVLLVGQAPDDGSPSLALAPPAARTVAAPASAQERLDVQAIMADRKLIRDARLDRYLAAHKQYGDSSAAAVPGGVLRASATVAPAR